ncbi:MAG: tRNA (adenosine(37)-N6)-dimethylallyltransferase MiaA [Fibrobacter sp.]|nr:tRNA (adenosine(37)-N6)-dimethylallyltransferase MiaA [Fibrobacter sp.]
MPILFAVAGATGIGKSGLALALARHYDAEIIGVDSRQIYEGFVIGTAQPSQAEMGQVKHHMVNFLDPREAFSAGDFCMRVRNLLEANPDRNYIAVGGTGLYLQSLMLGLPKIPKIDASVRADLEGKAACDGLDSLFKMAREVDPEAMTGVEAENAQRIIRILEVWNATGRKLSDWQKEREGGIGKIPVFWLQRERENLYARINRRVDKMMADGWLDEVLRLARTVPLNAPAWQSLGYRELLHASSPAEISRVVEDVKRKTRNYAKRQLTWFRWQVETIPVDMDALEDTLDFPIFSPK